MNDEKRDLDARAKWERYFERRIGGAGGGPDDVISATEGAMGAIGRPVRGRASPS